MSLSLVLTTVPRAKAAPLAKAAVKRRLAACGSISQVRSIYSWKGTLRDEAEALIIFKTTKERFRSSGPSWRRSTRTKHPKSSRWRLRG